MHAGLALIQGPGVSWCQLSMDHLYGTLYMSLAHY
jgi:hypothetical protein